MPTTAKGTAVAVNALIAALGDLLYVLATRSGLTQEDLARLQSRLVDADAALRGE